MSIANRVNQLEKALYPKGVSAIFDQMGAISLAWCAEVLAFDAADEMVDFLEMFRDQFMSSRFFDDRMLNRAAKWFEAHKDESLTERFSQLTESGGDLDKLDQYFLTWYEGRATRTTPEVDAFWDEVATWINKDGEK